MKNLGLLIAAATLALTGAAEASTNLISNGGFEAPSIPNTAYTYPGLNIGGPFEPATIDGWTYTGSALVNAQSSSAWYGSTAPAGGAGSQFAALQGTSTLSTTFSSTGSTLDVSWASAGRPNFGSVAGNQLYEILIDNKVFAPFATVSGTGFSTASFNATGISAGTHTLTFKGLVEADQTAFIDSVSVTAVPEPATWALFFLGFGAIGWTLRSGRRLGRTVATA